MENSSKINLMHMQKYFEEQSERVRIISDLELSENDYKSLGTKLKSLTFFAGIMNDIEDYILSIVVYSTYSLIYDEELKDFESVIWLILNKSQYMERAHLRMYRDAFEIFGLESFGIDDKDLFSACKYLTARHAGVPNSEKQQYFEILNNHIDCEIEQMYSEIYNELPVRTRFIFDLMDDISRNELLKDSRNLIRDVLNGERNRQMLFERYPNLSISLIDRCLMWDENNRYMSRYNIV